MTLFKTPQEGLASLVLFRINLIMQYLIPLMVKSISHQFTIGY